MAVHVTGTATVISIADFRDFDLRDARIHGMGCTAGCGVREGQKVHSTPLVQPRAMP
jgi:hypothetical protein